eukprot:scaffold89360_cov43-Attheya_sp.AAC.1
MELRPGWYLWASGSVAAGTPTARRRTIYVEPFTPLGIPFDKPGVLEALLDDTDLFMFLSVGQWKYVFEAILEYWRSRVESMWRRWRFHLCHLGPLPLFVSLRGNTTILVVSSSDIK